MISEDNITYAVDETLESGVRYTEKVGLTVRTLPVRYCELWKVTIDDPISDLEVLSFNQRFGAFSVPAEGIGGVETLLPFRRRGYVTKLMTKALVGMSQRVNIAFISEGIDHLYEKFGFATCLTEAHISLKVRTVMEQQADPTGRDAQKQIRSYAPDDLPVIVALYNETHAHRPWTHVRSSNWNRLMPHETWNPGSEVMILEEDTTLIGYAVFKGQIFGRYPSSFTVDEIAAKNADAVRNLLVAIANRCRELGLEEFIIREPIDSAVGWEARQLGCEYKQFIPHTGEMMGVILNREGLLEDLEPELRRRVPHESLYQEHDVAFPLLRRGELIPDNDILLRLIMGFWSMADAQFAGTSAPTRYNRICTAWFPGGGTQQLLTPYAHKLDRY